MTTETQDRYCVGTFAPQRSISVNGGQIVEIERPLQNLYPIMDRETTTMDGHPLPVAEIKTHFHRTNGPGWSALLIDTVKERYIPVPRIDDRRFQTRQAAVEAALAHWRTIKVQEAQQ